MNSNYVAITATVYVCSEKQMISKYNDAKPSACVASAYGAATKRKLRPADIRGTRVQRFSVIALNAIHVEFQL